MRGRKIRFDEIRFGEKKKFVKVYSDDVYTLVISRFN